MSDMINRLTLIGAVLALTACGTSVSPDSIGVETPAATVGFSGDVLETQGLSSTSKGGLLGKYSRSAGLFDFDHLKIDPAIDKFWLPRSEPLGSYSVRWNALLTTPQSETYTLFLTTLGNAALSVDGLVVLETSAPNTLKTKEISYVFKGKGQPSRLQVDYYHSGSLPGLIKLEWKNAHQRREVIPTKALTPIDLTADCPSVLSKACLPKFTIASSQTSLALIGLGSIHGALGIENKSELYPLNIQIDSREFPQFSGQYQVPPSAIFPIDLPFECSASGVTAGTISIKRVEDGATLQTDASLSCGETLPGPILVIPPANP
jgi:PA14 domain